MKWEYFQLDWISPSSGEIIGEVDGSALATIVEPDLMKEFHRVFQAVDGENKQTKGKIWMIKSDMTMIRLFLLQKTQIGVITQVGDHVTSDVLSIGEFELLQKWMEQL